MLLLVNCSEVSGYLLLYDTLSQFRQYHVRSLVGSYTPFCATVYVPNKRIRSLTTIVSMYNPAS